MFWHNFKYTLRIMFRNKMMIFWTFAFPLILGTFFNLAFSNIENSEKLDTIDIAIVENENFLHNEEYQKIFESFSKEDDEDRLFDVSYVDIDEAAKLLEDDKIAGYVIFEDEPKVVIASNGIDETVLKTFVGELAETNRIYEMGLSKAFEDMRDNPTILKEEIGKIYAENMAKINAAVQSATANIKDETPSNMSYTMIEFYTLIAMTCLYGGIIGMYAVNQNLADMSKKGRRVAVSPTKKRTVILSSVLASYVVQVLGLAILFIYTIAVLKVDYGPDLLSVIILSLVGCMGGLSLGVAIATVFKTNEDTKMGIIISVTMLGCFFSGMMGITMKYVVDSNVPILNMINPANMITDGLYALYYYTDRSRFYFDLISLLAFSGVMIVLAIVNLRRKTYDSI